MRWRLGGMFEEESSLIGGWVFALAEWAVSGAESWNRTFARSMNRIVAG